MLYININCFGHLLKPHNFGLSHFPGVPEPPRSCELRNDSNLEVVCQPGNDGGLQQHFVLEAVGATSMYFNNLDSTRSTHEILDNEISTMNDQVRKIFPFRFEVNGNAVEEGLGLWGIVHLIEALLGFLIPDEMESLGNVHKLRRIFLIF